MGSSPSYSYRPIFALAGGGGLRYDGGGDCMTAILAQTRTDYSLDR